MPTRYYYRYQIERLPACTLTIHGLLHITEGIRYCAPVWTTWSFFMERYCGALQRSIRTRSQPWSNLNAMLLHSIELEQLSVHYDLGAELAFWNNREHDGPVGYEHVFPDCKYWGRCAYTTAYCRGQTQIMLSAPHSRGTPNRTLCFRNRSHNT